MLPYIAYMDPMGYASPMLTMFVGEIPLNQTFSEHIGHPGRRGLRPRLPSDALRDPERAPGERWLWAADGGGVGGRPVSSWRP